MKTCPNTHWVSKHEAHSLLESQPQPPQTNTHCHISQPDQDNPVPLDIESQFSIVRVVAVESHYEVMQLFSCWARRSSPLEQPPLLHPCAKPAGFVILIS